MLIATNDSVYEFGSNTTQNKPELVISKIEVRRIVKGRKRSVIALVDGSILLFEEGRKKRIESGIPDRIDSLCMVEEEPLNLLVGCTPPNLYTLKENEGVAVKNDCFGKLESRREWYTPWGGPAAIRSMAMSSDGWVYADIHVGSIMRSNDLGDTWEPVNPELHEDVHEVATSVTDTERVYANTYLSVYVSQDRGESWSHRSEKLRNRYGRGIAISPEDPNILLCAVSNGPRGTDVQGQLYRTSNAGKEWEHVSNGFPDSTRKNIDTFHIAFENKDVAWVTDEERLYVSTDKGLSWELFWEAPSEIQQITCRKQNTG